MNDKTIFQIFLGITITLSGISLALFIYHWQFSHYLDFLYMGSFFGLITIAIGCAIALDRMISNNVTEEM